MAKILQLKISLNEINNKTERKRKLGRNERCHCGSGKKYKKCCLDKDIKKRGEQMRVDY